MIFRFVAVNWGKIRGSSLIEQVLPQRVQEVRDSRKKALKALVNSEQ
jgi:hypothetical protein